MRKKQPEQDLQISVVKFIRMTCPDITLVAIPNGGYRRPIEAMIMKAAGVTSGVSDLMFLWKNTVAFIELKVDKAPSSISPAQKAFLIRLTDYNIPCGVATSVEEVMALLRQWDAPVRVSSL